MSIRHGLLALLSRGPRYGYQLRVEFEASTGATWPLNIAGRAELERWFSTPVAQDDRPRDELAIKIAMAVAGADVDTAEVILTQRMATMRALQDLIQAKRVATGGLAQRLVLDSLIFKAEAEQRWLDHCEAVSKEKNP
ncbi:PadR family transcriptional regulator [Nonomuraea turkmeniaca]|uniref:PadR family transcriptional regulator n=1 Tax=Nonomuraea turkmeniaca TaxID=103838 RepID=A0A5S4G6D8_9ACTN|nr:PadR family transcriptional regulator [Nonomuraea turkmeniaca]TMR21560.1 PadR family transcriptional regulator [Nonomuraea turkmeniaca]